MACKTSFELHHNFPKLAEESGFAFNPHRPRVHIDWNRIKLLDVESLIKDRKFVLLENHLNDILDCVLESEFDLRILDDGVVKMFRLAQLAVEYQQFCRHYLDRSVFVLREEINGLAQELSTVKKELREKEDECRKLRKKSRHSVKNPPAYANDNIATMILKTLSNKYDVYPSNNAENLMNQNNRCEFCEKVFLNQLYLKSHIARRHSNLVEAADKGTLETGEKPNETSKLNTEIMELKSKLKEMESLITNVHNSQKPVSEKKAEESKTKVDSVQITTRDAEVSTSYDDLLLEKIEEWKKAEHEKYNKEINILRQQITEIVDTFKEKDSSKQTLNVEDIIQKLQNTIKEQSSEIVSLKDLLIKSKTQAEKENSEVKKESQIQTELWSKRAETQAKQYEALLHQFNEVVKEAQETKQLAEVDKNRFLQLQEMFAQHISKSSAPENDVKMINLPKNGMKINVMDQSIQTRQESVKKVKSIPSSKSLEELHQKAQELLNMRSVSSSDLSSTASEEDNRMLETRKLSPKIQIKESVEVNMQRPETPNPKRSHKSSNHIQSFVQNKSEKRIKSKNKKKGKIENDCNHLNELISKETRSVPMQTQGSPSKLVRAKITEEVNNRLIAFGVDPLRVRIPRNLYHKQKMQLQQQQEVKVKKNPAHEKVRYTILAYLDSNIPDVHLKKEKSQTSYISPTKAGKSFSFTSVISNVKNKALSLVKSTENKSSRNLDAEVTKRAVSFLKTPPGSSPSSPTLEKGLPIESESSSIKFKNKTKSNKLHTNISSNKQVPLSDESESVSSTSNHNYYNSTIPQEIAKKSIENLIKSPAHRPSSANEMFNHVINRYVTENDTHLTRTQSALNIKMSPTNNVDSKVNNDNSSDDIESLIESPLKQLDDGHRQTEQQKKGVLKNASSTSSLNKKKVLFDMEAIQMKSISASPSQSTTEKSETNEKYDLGLINLDGEEWDISSIDNDPINKDTKIEVNPRTSPKIAELKQTIEAQLAHRTVTPSTFRIGVDVLKGPDQLTKANSLAGSTTSLGSSILDDSASPSPRPKQKAFVKPKNVPQKDDLDIDISEFSFDGLNDKKDDF